MGQKMSSKEVVSKLGKFKLGDLVDSFGCELGCQYMPGTGEIIEIRPGDEQPFVCRHNNRDYFYKESEIEHTDMY